MGVEFLLSELGLHLKFAIARENALLQLKPVKTAVECREFE